MKKRIAGLIKPLHILCSVIIVFTMMFSEYTDPMASTAPSVTVDSMKGNLGEQVTVNISITPDSQMAAGSFRLKYDPVKLEVVSAKAGEPIQKSNPIINKVYTSDSIKVLWAGTSSINSEGSLCTIVFNIKEDAHAGLTNLDILDLKLADIDENFITASITNGTINICEFSSEFKVTNMQITDDAGHEISRLPDSGTIKATASITQKVVTAKRPVLVIALYDANSRIKSVKYEKVELLQHETKTISTSLLLSGDVSGCYAKVMVWDGLNTMHPISRISRLR